MSLTDLSKAVLAKIESRPTGLTLRELEGLTGKRPQEVEGAVSQLKRLGYVDQRTGGLWVRARNKVERQTQEHDHARIREHALVDHGRGLLDPPNTPKGCVPVLKAPADAPAATGETGVGPACAPRHEASTAAKATTPAAGAAAGMAGEAEEAKVAKQRLRTCVKCKEPKGARAFEAGKDTCRGCQGTNKGVKQKAAKATARKDPERAAPRRGLKSIVARHVRRSDEDPVLAQLHQVRSRIADKLAAIDQAIAAYEKAA